MILFFRACVYPLRIRCWHNSTILCLLQVLFHIFFLFFFNFILHSILWHTLFERIAEKLQFKSCKLRSHSLRRTSLIVKKMLTKNFQNCNSHDYAHFLTFKAKRSYSQTKKYTDLPSWKYVWWQCSKSRNVQRCANDWNCNSQSNKSKRKQNENWVETTTYFMAAQKTIETTTIQMHAYWTGVQRNIQKSKN